MVPVVDLEGVVRKESGALWDQTGYGVRGGIMISDID